MDKIMLASYCFKYHPSLYQVSVKEYIDIWAMLYKDTVINKQNKIKNKDLYKTSQLFIKKIIKQCEENPNRLDKYYQRVLELLVFEINIVIKKTKMSDSEKKKWNKYLITLNKIIEKIKLFTFVRELEDNLVIEKDDNTM